MLRSIFIQNKAEIEKTKKLQKDCRGESTVPKIEQRHLTRPVAKYDQINLAVLVLNQVH